MQVESHALGLATHQIVQPWPWRWIVERSFAWLDNARGICRVFEELPENHEGMIYATSIRLMLRKLTARTRKWVGSS
jgi:transposase